jgi:hypothetical protein
MRNGKLIVKKYQPGPKRAPRLRGVRPADTHRVRHGSGTGPSSAPALVHAHARVSRVTRSIREKATREHEPAYTRTAKGQDGRTEQGLMSRSFRQGALTNGQAGPFRWRHHVSPLLPRGREGSKDERILFTLSQDCSCSLWRV